MHVVFFHNSVGQRITSRLDIFTVVPPFPVHMKHALYDSLLQGSTMALLSCLAAGKKISTAGEISSLYLLPCPIELAKRQLKHATKTLLPAHPAGKNLHCRRFFLRRTALLSRSSGR
jgi:hypothetical protein